MSATPTFIDTKTIIVNLLKADRKSYLRFDRLLELLSFIYDKLKDQCELKHYNIFFNVDLDSIERTVRYNAKIFGLDIDAGTIYLREPQSIDLLAEQYQVDDIITHIISEYEKLCKIVV